MPKLDRSPFQPGTLVGNYRLVRRLGRGGMGDVHVAERVGSAPVALKLMTTLVGDLELQNERFVREAESLKVLSHPAIVRVLDHGFDPATATPFLVMELLEGEDLGARAGRGPLAEDDVVAIGLDLAAGLAEVHAHRLVHRDVKPPNVILPARPGRGARGVLCDFGLAKRVDMASSLTKTGALVGTPHFMSPEQFLDAKRVSEASDVFSLALTLLTAYVGKNPLSEARTTTALMMALCTRPIPRVEELVTDRVPSRAFSEALRSALATDPQERASLADLRRALGAVAAHPVSVPAPRTLPLGALGSGPATSRRSVAPRARASRSSRPDAIRAPLRLAAGEYRFKKELATDLYDGVDHESHPVRLERLRGLLTTRDGEAALQEEATTFGAVLGESVLALLDHGREGDDAWLVTEAWSGPNLVEEIGATGPLPYARALASFARLARGLTALHESGVVHGFLDPSSFHFRKVQKRKVLVLHDLGILKRVEGRLRAASSKRVGPKRDPRGDVVQVVSSLYFAAIGKVPFGPRIASKEADAAHATHAAPDPVGRAALDDLVRRTIEGRVATLVALADELDALLARTTSL